jgi:cytochrome c-type biogenesis protein
VFEIILAFFAGILAFLSPCVLPLVPAYVSYMASRLTNSVAIQTTAGTANTVSQGIGARFAMGLHSIAFVLGFTTIFVLLMLPFSLLSYVFEGILTRLGGILIVIFGLHFMGVIPKFFTWLRARTTILANPLITILIAILSTVVLLWGFTGTLNITQLDSDYRWSLITGGFLSALVWLALFLGDAFTHPQPFWTKALNTFDMLFYADTRQQRPNQADKGLWGSFTMGTVFAAGWTPCIGPVLGAAMGLAMNEGALFDATLRITAFSFGLGIPFIFTALLFDSVQGYVRKLNRHLPKVQLVTGALLIFIGLMMITGQMKSLSTAMNSSFGDVTIRIEECFERTFRGRVAWGDFVTCASDNVPIPVLEYQHTGREITSGEIRSILRNYPDYQLDQVLTAERIQEALADVPTFTNPATNDTP